MPASAAPSHLQITRQGGVETIAINRPEVMNATTAATGRQLLAAVREARHDPDVRAIVLTGVGRAFCAGADLQALDGPLLPSGRPDLGTILRDVFNPLVLAIRSAPVPVIAAVNGPAVGVGCSIALACDLVIAGDTASFIAGFSKVGLALDGGLSVLLAARVGFTHASQLALVGGAVGAERAHAIGLVDETVAGDALQARAAELAATLAASASGALAASKRLLDQAVFAGLEDALAREADAQAQRVETDEYAEGVAAFLGRRPPRFA